MFISVHSLVWSDLEGICDLIIKVVDCNLSYQGIYGEARQSNKVGSMLCFSGTPCIVFGVY